nr:MAG TPA: hypothetical protein [Caudoviricetes sp.]
MSKWHGGQGGRIPYLFKWFTLQNRPKPIPD